jgi:hypothetical protein
MLSPILFILHYLTKKILKGFGDFSIGQVIHTVKYAEGLVLMAKEEMVQQGMMTLQFKLETVMEW